MSARIVVWCTTAGTGLLLLVGCIHHESTVYRDAPRTSVEFENDRAARVFYEALNERSSKNARTESKTDVDLPIVFHNQQRVVSGPNTAFNHAVEICDSNHDGRITEQEARIYAENKR